MAKPRKTARKTARKPTRKPTRKPREVKLAPEKLEKLYGEFTAQGIASVEIPTAPEGLLKVQRS
jgi:hypothetical protein